VVAVGQPSNAEEAEFRVLLRSCLPVPMTVSRLEARLVPTQEGAAALTALHNEQRALLPDVAADIGMSVKRSVTGPAATSAANLRYHVSEITAVVEGQAHSLHLSW
jgi:hypothetical protein